MQSHSFGSMDSARRVVAPLVIGLLAWAASPQHATADASLEDADGELTLQEIRFVHDVQIIGPVALVESQQVIANPGSSDAQAVYLFDVPINAAVTSLEVRFADGRTSSTIITDVDTLSTQMPDPEALAAMPDPGLLRLVGRDMPEISGPSPYARATYELRVYPVQPGNVVTVTTRWVAPLSYHDGRLSLRIPSRGEAPNLVRENVQLTLAPPSGASRFAAVHGGGKLLGKNLRRAQFTALPRADIVIDVMPELSPGAAAQLSFAAIPIGDGFGAIGLSVLTPLPYSDDRLMFERALLVIDVSRSLGKPGVEAAAELADALLASLPQSATVEVVLFDRSARQVFGSLVPNGHDARRTVAKALASSSLDNGSDLGDALELARKLLARDKLGARPAEGLERGGRATTLLAVISDGMAPLELSPRRAADRLGDDALRDIELVALTLVPDAAPVPDASVDAAAALALQTGGRAIAMRMAEVAARAKNLSAELSQPAPLHGLTLNAGSATLDKIALPSSLEPGEGIVAVGFYHGPMPKRLTLSGEQRHGPLSIVGKRDLGLSRAALPLAIAGAIQEDFIPLDQQDATTTYDRGTLASARRALVRASTLAPALTQHSAMIALPAGDRFAQDRMVLSRKWGPTVFMRLPPPPEQRPGFRLRDYEERVITSGGAEAAPRRTGELDRDIIAGLIATYVLPKARICYERALRQNVSLHGSLVLVLEIARGEVQYARSETSTFPAAVMEACVVEAAYSIQVPVVALGDDPETIGIVRYPIAFKKRKQDVAQEPLDLGTPLDLSVPLDGPR